jgi:cellobiose epimerase
MNIRRNTLNETLYELTTYLEKRLIPFWMNNGIDEEGGYHTAFDERGEKEDVTDKLIVSQTRMIWAFSKFYERNPQKTEFLAAARHGFDFFVKNFWDEENGGWYWLVSRDGKVLDGGKVLYGQGFAIYALSQYYQVSGDVRALDFAERTFNLLQIHASDTVNGGYYENFEADWTISESGFSGGDRKSVDIHLHLMEAFTTLVLATGKTVHKRKLEELVLLIIQKMINKNEMCVYNQFDLSFNPIPAIYVKRTWRSVRERGSISRVPADTTSYGYNIELAWLLNRAGEALGLPDDFYADITKRLADYTLNYGFDHVYGGIYRDGTHDGIILMYEKDFWQTCEALIGLLDTYQHTFNSKYLEAFLLNWDFARKNFVNPITGEWYQQVSREGEAVIKELNLWRSAFHTGRAIMESIDRLTVIIKQDDKR